MATILEALAIAARHQQAGRLQLAEQICRNILAVEQNQPQAWHLLGVVSAQFGKHQAAVECIRRALAIQPDWAAAHNNLGSMLSDQARLDEAVICLRRALELRPDFAEAYNNLGIALKKQGKLDEAVACYRRALELSPDDAKAHYNLGIVLQDQRKLDAAVACYRRTLELKPDLAEAHNNLGNALRDRGELDEAVACHRRALELKPDYAEASSNLGNVFKDQGKLDEAAACYRQAVQLELRSVLGGQGQPAASTRPRNAEKHNSLGMAFAGLAAIFQSRLPDDDVLAMRQLLAEPSPRGDGRTALQYGLAQVLDARGDYDAAALHLAEANAARLAALKERNRDYRSAGFESFIGGMLATFTPQFFARVSGFGLETELPVFVVGLPRSGTTLVEQILASHSRVFGAGELHYCEETFQSLPKVMNRNDTSLGCLPDLDRETTLLLPSGMQSGYGLSTGRPCASWTRCSRITSTSV